MTGKPVTLTQLNVTIAHTNEAVTYKYNALAPEVHSETYLIFIFKQFLFAEREIN